MTILSILLVDWFGSSSVLPLVQLLKFVFILFLFMAFFGCPALATNEHKVFPT